MYQYNEEDITEACEKCGEIRPLSHLVIRVVENKCYWMCAKCERKYGVRKVYNIDEAVRQVLEKIGEPCKRFTT